MSMKKWIKNQSLEHVISLSYSASKKQNFLFVYQVIKKFSISPIRVNRKKIIWTLKNACNNEFCEVLLEQSL